MVMSIGFNPFYKNTVRSAEVHVMHGFGTDFYGREMRIVIVGFIRKELNYESLEKLVGELDVLFFMFWGCLALYDGGCGCV